MTHAGGADRFGTARQRGIAIITVLLIVALVATLAASLVWRELVAVRDVENQRVAAQTMWVERAAVEWSRQVLREQATASNVVYAGQRWSLPVKNLALADFLPRNVLAVNGELARAKISGEMEDAQAKFNLMNLVSRAGPSAPFQINAEGLAAYRRLLSSLGLSPGLAQLTAAHMLQSLGDGAGANGWPLQLVTVDDLIRIPGYDARTVQTLMPLVTVLPDFTMVNANTATAPVLTAAIPTLSAGQAQTLIERRNTAYFVSTGDIATVLAAGMTNGELPAGSLVGVNSGYFIVHCRIVSDRIDTRVDTLIARYGIGDFSWTAVVWVHRLTS